MMAYMTNRAGRGAKSLLRTTAVTALLALPLMACDVDSLLDVEDPDVATPGSVRDPSALPVVFGGAVADFAQAYGGSGNSDGGSRHEGQILLSGLLGDEFIATGTFDTRIRIDRRDILTAADGTSDNGQLEDAYRNLHRARIAAENGAELFAVAGSANDPDRAELFSLAGYTYVFFGENYCSGVPFSRFPLDGGAPELGTPTPTTDIFRLAVERFDSALALNPGSPLARIGKARALVNLNEYAAAAQVVSNVSTSFTHLIFYSDNTLRQENGTWKYTTDFRRYGVSDREGGEGLPYRSANDPRVPWAENGKPFDATLSFPHFTQLKYPDRGAEIPLATGIEARLIEAEAALNRGGSADYLPILNDLRATAGLAALTDPGSAEARVGQFFQERAFWLWLTSHRLGDMRRLIRQYQQPESEVFPSGEYFRLGSSYGSDKNLPVFVDELNNPNFGGCINRDA